MRSHPKLLVSLCAGMAALLFCAGCSSSPARGSRSVAKHTYRGVRGTVGTAGKIAATTVKTTGKVAAKTVKTTGKVVGTTAQVGGKTALTVAKTGASAGQEAWRFTQRFHKIRLGDTLNGVAAFYGVPPPQIKQLNPALEKGKLIVGNWLQLRE